MLCKSLYGTLKYSIAGDSGMHNRDHIVAMYTNEAIKCGRYCTVLVQLFLHVHTVGWRRLLKTWMRWALRNEILLACTLGASKFKESQLIFDAKEWGRQIEIKWNRNC